MSNNHRPIYTTWYLRSYGDRDTHQGQMHPDGTVLSRCGVVFQPRPISRGVFALPSNPADPDQICPQCRDGVPANRGVVR
jgi:hypothetical protein